MQENSIGPDIISDNVRDYATIHLRVPRELREAFEIDLRKVEEKKEKLENELGKLLRMISAEGYDNKVEENVKEINKKKVSFCFCDFVEAHDDFYFRSHHSKKS